jgi:CBS domain-containing protein
MHPALCAKDIMQKELTWASPEDSIQQTLAKMQQCNTSYILISRNGTLEGIVSKSDLTGAVSPYLRPEFAKWRRPLDDATLQIKVKWIMGKLIHTITPQTPLVDIIRNMCQFGLYALPVIDEQGKVQGLVTEVNVFKAMLKLMGGQDPPTPEKTHQEQAASEQPAEQAASEQPAEQAASEQPPEQAASEQPAEQAASEQPPEQVASEQPPEQAASEQPAEQAASEQPAEQATSEQPAEQAASEQPPEQAASEQPAVSENAQPATETTQNL